jgi:hypothetical protein
MELALFATAVGRACGRNAWACPPYVDAAANEKTRERGKGVAYVTGIRPFGGFFIVNAPSRNRMPLRRRVHSI